MVAASSPALEPVATAATAAVTTATCTDTVIPAAGMADAAMVVAPTLIEVAADLVASIATTSLIICLRC